MSGHSRVSGYAIATRQDWLAAVARLQEPERKRVLAALAKTPAPRVWIPCEGQRRETLLRALGE